MRNARPGRRVRAASVGLTAALLLAACTANEPPGPVESSVDAGPSQPTTPATEATTATPEPTYVSTVTVDPLLPSAEPLPAGLLDTTDARWLISSVSAASTAQPTDDTAYASASYLIAPEGTRYELPGVDGLQLDQWLPGTALALAYEDDDTGTRVVVVDLETGRVTGTVDLEGLRRESGLDAVEASVTFVGDGTTDVLATVTAESAGVVARLTVDGQVLTRVEQPWSTVVPSPDRRHLLAVAAGGHPVVVDPETLTVVADPVEPAVDCTASRWLDDSRWLARCPAVGGWSWFVAGLDTAPSPVPVEPGSWLDGLTSADDGSVLVRGSGTEDDPEPVLRAAAGTVARADTPITAALTARGTSVIGTDAAPGPDLLDSWWPTPLLAWDAVTGHTTTLVPAPTPDGATSHVAVIAAPGFAGVGSLYFDNGHLGVLAD
jgi:hypothetical protein